MDFDIFLYIYIFTEQEHQAITRCCFLQSLTKPSPFLCKGNIQIMHVPWKQASETSKWLCVKQVQLGYKNLLNDACVHHRFRIPVPHTCTTHLPAHPAMLWLRDAGERYVIGCCSRGKLSHSPGEAEARGNLLNCESGCGFRKSALAVKFVSAFCVFRILGPQCTEL